MKSIAGGFFESKKSEMSQINFASRYGRELSTKKRFHVNGSSNTSRTSPNNNMARLHLIINSTAQRPANSNRI